MAGEKRAATFHHSSYGLDTWRRLDFTESWFLASLPGNPFFMKWRDLLKELLHNRVDVDGLLQHPLYKNLALDGFDRLNREFSGFQHDFREYLAIHAMCHRLIEKDASARKQWDSSWIRHDAASTAFALQLHAEKNNMHVAEVFMSDGRSFDK